MSEEQAVQSVVRLCVGGRDAHSAVRAAQSDNWPHAVVHRCCHVNSGMRARRVDGLA